jgi:hypothetical protein
MRLHHTVIDRLVRIYTTYGGYREETRLKEELSKLDLTAYERQTGESILVESQELRKQASGPAK